MSAERVHEPPPVLELADAVERLSADGQAVALEGFTHLIPFAAAHELIRRQRRDLTLIRMTPDVVYDQMIGVGMASELVFSYGGNPGVGSLHRFRDAVENGWPRPLRTTEHSHAGMANAYVAGASRLPFGVLRGYRGTGLAETNPDVASVTCPFTGEQLSAVRAVRPDLAVIHAQQADRHGNVMLWGLVGVQKEAVLAAERALVTVEELVEELEPRPGAIVLPAWTVSAISVVPGGAHPPTPPATRPATTTSTSPGTRSRAIATGSGPGSRRKCSVAEPAAKPEEVMTINAARVLRDGEVCLVGVGPPNAAVNLARRLHAPNCVLVYESGAIGSKPAAPAALDRRRRPRRDRRRDRLACPRCSTTGSAAGGSTSASSAPRRSTAAGRSTPR